MNYSDFTVIIPTLNEERTIGELLRYIERNYRGIRVMVVDDGSEDKTKEIVSGLSKNNSGIVFFDRHARGLEKGLTASIIDGALQSRTRYIITIDADMQHPPNRIRDVAEKLRKGRDLVVADRAVVTNWALYRRMISRIFMYTGKIILYLAAKETCVDIFSGFFGVKRDIFTETYKKNKRRFVKEGYKVLFDFLKCVDRGTLTIDNAPFVFNIRRFGESKAGFRQGLALFKSFVS